MSRSLASKPIVHGYSILKLILDDERGESARVGVVAWDAERDWFGVRLLAEDETVSGIAGWNRRLLEIAWKQIERWTDSKQVPYEAGSLSPSTERFWRAVSEVLSTAIQLEAPRAMDPMQAPDEEIESLFEAIVQPRQSQRRKTVRIDGALSRALGGLSDVIPSRAEVSAFGGAHETVRHGLVTPKGVLLIDGVNLSANRARTEADALVSRFLRIKSGYESSRVKMIVGYTASPGGLNGEGHMAAWMKTQLTDQVFDLTRQGSEFRAAARDAVLSVEERTQEELSLPEDY